MKYDVHGGLIIKKIANRKESNTKYFSYFFLNPKRLFSCSQSTEFKDSVAQDYIGRKVDGQRDFDEYETTDGKQNLKTSISILN